MNGMRVTGFNNGRLRAVRTSRWETEYDVSRRHAVRLHSHLAALQHATHTQVCRSSRRKHQQTWKQELRGISAARQSHAIGGPRRCRQQRRSEAL